MGEPAGRGPAGYTVQCGQLSFVISRGLIGVTWNFFFDDSERAISYSVKKLLIILDSFLYVNEESFSLEWFTLFLKSEI